MRFMNIKSWLVSVLALALAACGGGGGGAGGDPVLGGGTGSTPTTPVSGLIVTLSAPSVVNTGTATVTATVTALDANNNTVKGVPVTLAADNNGVVTIQGAAGSVTGDNGRLLASVGIGADQSNRSITLTASSGAVSGKATLRVVDAPTGTVPASIDVIAAAPVVGTGGDEVRITAFVKDANNNALSNAPVAFRTDTGVLSSVSTVTNSAGVAAATLSAGQDKSNRTAVVTVSSATTSGRIELPITGTTLTLQGPTSLLLGKSASFDVVATDSKGNVIPGIAVTGSSALGNPLVAASGTTTGTNGSVRYTYTASTAGSDTLVFRGAGATVSPQAPLAISSLDFEFVSPAASTSIPVGTATPVTVRLLSGGVPVSGQTIAFAATGGTLSAASAVTQVGSGQATVQISSSSAGPLTVQASVNLGGTVSSTTLPLVVVGTVPSKLVLQINTTALAPNSAGSTTHQARLLAKVTDSAGNPVQGQTVNFTRLVDPSGGNLLQVSDVTDANGQASVNYASGPQSTASNGVVLGASVAGFPAASGQASLTVNQAALFIALGTGNVIGNINPQTYQKDWTAYVTDANGIAVNGATLTIKAIPSHYRTGAMVLNLVTRTWVYASPIWECPNEDGNANGILDLTPVSEDDNNDGVLWPGNVVSVTPGTAQTVNGLSSLSLIYAESYAPWLRLDLTVSTTVAGTESANTTNFLVTGSAPDFSEAGGPPAGSISPFGALPTAAALASGKCQQLL